MHLTLGADHVAQTLTTQDGDCGFRVQGGGGRGRALYECGLRACDLVAVLGCQLCIDGVGTRSLKLKSGSYSWVVGVDDDVEVLAAGYGGLPYRHPSRTPLPKPRSLG